MSAEFRRFLARLAIDPEAYCQYLVDPRAAARDAGLTESEQELLAGGDQNRLYAALISDPAGSEKSK